MIDDRTKRIMIAWCQQGPERMERIRAVGRLTVFFHEYRPIIMHRELTLEEMVAPIPPPEEFTYRVEYAVEAPYIYVICEDVLVEVGYI